MRKSDFTNKPELFGRSNYLVREMLAFVEHALKNQASSGAQLLEYWDTNAALVRAQLVLAALAAPTVTAAPTLAGTATVGQTLTATTGVYTGSPTVTKAWLRDGVAISGATAGTYVLVEADATKTLTYRETATNAKGSVQSTSNAKGPVAAS